MLGTVPNAGVAMVSQCGHKLSDQKNVSSFTKENSSSGTLNLS
jgi:hypothetical protein